MATCLQIVSYAMQMTGVLALGKTPKAAEQEAGLVALQSLYDEWRTGGMFGELIDEYLTEDQDAEEGRRYLLASGVTVTAPTLIAATTSDYGLNDYASGASQRGPRDLALYETVDSLGAQVAKLFDRTGWVDLLGLESGDTAPLSARNRYGLAACLATSGGFLGAFGVQPNPTTVAAARHFLSNIMGRNGSTQDRSPATYF